MIINSLLDTDLYTFSVGKAVQTCFPKTQVSYRFINRTIDMVFSDECFEAIKENIMALDRLRLTKVESEWLKTSFPYLTDEYVCWIENMILNPTEEIEVLLVDGKIQLEIKGDWAKTIFYEVPILAIISECYFKYMDTDWDYDGQICSIENKASELSLSGCKWADFGTRRRRSFISQENVVKTMSKYDNFVGTSNVLLAMKYGLKCTGTQSHQYFMGVSALRGLRCANYAAMNEWIKVFDANLGTVLTDTFGTEAFFNDFNLKFAKTFDGVRHDSGCPFEFADKIINHYLSLGIDPTTKTIIFSDGLDVATARKIQIRHEGMVRCSFGIGTHLTNDFMKKSDPTQKSKPLSIVIKLRQCNGVEVVKISDEPGKMTGDKDAQRVAAWTFFGTPLDS